MTENQRSPRRSRRTRDDTGSIAPFIVTVVVVLMAAAGLVIDGGAALNTRMKLADDLEHAARMGATHMDVQHFRNTGERRLDRAAAESAAQQYLRERGYSQPRARVVGSLDTINVSANDRTETSLLSLIGITSIPATAEATAEVQAE